MDRHGYVNAWRKSVRKAAEAVAEKSPARGAEIARAWLRDFRSTFRSELTNKGVPEPLIRYLMGHTRDVSQGYYQPSRPDLENAILRLGATTNYAPNYAPADWGRDAPVIQAINA